MSLTNKEQILMLEISTKISPNNKIEQFSEKDKDSYYEDCMQSRFFKDKIYEYDFEKPVEFEQKLREMWEYQGCEFMFPYLEVATISTFKYFKEEAVKSVISPYIYEF